MKIGEYLCKKYKSATPSRMSKIEADIFNIPYPLARGWVKKYAEVELWPEQLQRLGILPGKVAEKAKRKDKNGKPKSYAAMMVRELSGPVTVTRIAQTKKAKSNSRKPPKLPYVNANSPDFLSSFSWRVVRMQALKLHGPICMCCGDTPKNGAVMNVDHIKPRQTHPHLALELDNLQILCHACNHGKSNWDDTDWRESNPDSEFGLEDYSLAAISKVLSKF